MPIKCRKCGGDHFTSKCGKDKPVIEKKEPVCVKVSDVKPSKKRNFVRKPRKTISKNKKSEGYIRTFKVKLTNIPDDLTLQNLNKMMIGWGKVGNIKIRNDNYKGEKNYYSIIEFYDKDAAEYFIKAVDRTPLGFLLLSATLI